MIIEQRNTVLGLRRGYEFCDFASDQHVGDALVNCVLGSLLFDFPTDGFVFQEFDFNEWIFIRHIL